MADYGYIVQTGVIVPDTADLQAAVVAEYQAAFGADLVTTANTPQGVLIVAEVEARDATVRNNVALANQINPDLAGGVYLDAIWALMGGGRVAATKSLVANVTLTGVPNTIVPAGVQASVGDGGPLFELTGTVQIGLGGSTTGIFQALDTGPIAAPAHDLDTIVTGVLGWETVDNPQAADLGQNGESDVASRQRRRDTLGLQSVALPTSMIAGENEVDGVRSVLFRENYTDANVTIEGVVLLPHSIFVCVQGGTDADAARVALSRKSSGANWNGTTTVAVTEPESGQIYQVKIQRPATLLIYVKATVKQGNEIGNPQDLVKSAILAYAAGEIDNDAGLKIGVDVSPWELAGAINRQSPGIYVQKIEIGLDPLALASDVLPVTIAQVAEILEGSIQVVVVA